jgi:hypothetical protein
MRTDSKTILRLLQLIRSSFFALRVVCFFRRLLNEGTRDVVSQKISTRLATFARIFVISSAILLDTLRLVQPLFEILGGQTHIQSEFNAGTKMDIELPTL